MNRRVVYPASSGSSIAAPLFPPSCRWAETWPTRRWPSSKPINPFAHVLKIQLRRASRGISDQHSIKPAKLSTVARGIDVSSPTTGRVRPLAHRGGLDTACEYGFPPRAPGNPQVCRGVWVPARQSRTNHLAWTIVEDQVKKLTPNLEELTEDVFALRQEVTQAVPEDMVEHAHRAVSHLIVRRPRSRGDARHRSEKFAGDSMLADEGDIGG